MVQGRNTLGYLRTRTFYTPERKYSYKYPSITKCLTCSPKSLFYTFTVRCIATAIFYYNHVCMLMFDGKAIAIFRYFVIIIIDLWATFPGVNMVQGRNTLGYLRTRTFYTPERKYAYKYTSITKCLTCSPREM
jgi:hypothetical protein